MQQQTEWFVFFLSREGNSREPSFPSFMSLQPDKEASRQEGRRVLDALKKLGDQREWWACGCPYPILASAREHSPPKDWWCLRSTD